MTTQWSTGRRPKPEEDDEPEAVERIASALERIADVLERLSREHYVEVEAEEVEIK